ncbi:OX-2 membrane glycoprotein-like [Hyperolius riggenbachi]|uniref:OX-2 membrane glycoprotein-like n=1 Tax=Hyperolius riggenbachi TaxID=752182 RepID=UPI0035A304CB
MEKREATVGENVTLQCQLETNPSNIFQITWQKDTGNFTGPVATCSKFYGEKLLGYSAGRTAQHTVDTLNVSSITINPVTLEDQGCFKCIFNVYPFGANAGTICLDVYETKISDPMLDVHHVNSSDPSEPETFNVVTCSATGWPAPEISWTVTDGLQITPENFTIENPDRTVTIISNFTHRITKSLEGAVVTCVVRHPALPSDKHLSVNLDEKGSKVADSQLYSVIIAVSLFLLCMCAFCGGFIMCCKLSKKGHSFLGMQPRQRISTVSSQEQSLLTVHCKQ